MASSGQAVRTEMVRRDRCSNGKNAVFFVLVQLPSWSDPKIDPPVFTFLQFLISQYRLSNWVNAPRKEKDGVSRVIM